MEEGLQEKGNIVLLITIILVMFGLLMILSVSSFKTNILFLKQLVWALLGFLLIFFISKKDLSWWNKYYIVFFLIFLFFLFISLFSESLKGVKRWLIVNGVVLFQPSEFMKIFFLAYLSSCFSKENNNIIPPSIVLGIILAILFFQPHFGMAGLFFILTLFFFILAKVKIRDIFIFIILFSLIGKIAIDNNDYVKDRIEKFLKKDNFQVEQAEIALGAGGISGVGLGDSMQKLFCIPLVYSDFIFPIIGEEIGFIGSFILLGIFSFFAYYGFSIAWHSSSKFGFFLSFSLTFSIVFQAIINIMVVLGNLPTTGLPLPFISYGGSSLVSNLIAVGFIMNASREG